MAEKLMKKASRKQEAGGSDETYSSILSCTNKGLSTWVLKKLLPSQQPSSCYRIETPRYK